MTENGTSYKSSHLMVQWGIYFAGLLVMCLGIVLTIKANLGSAPWDVLHIGLYRQFGLTIGTWSMIVGFAVLTAAAIGTFVFSVTIGPIVGIALPQCQSLVNRIWMRQVHRKMNGLSR